MKRPRKTRPRKPLVTPRDPNFPLMLKLKPKVVPGKKELALRRVKKIDPEDLGE